jgi:predicted transcriptional regulator
MHVLCDIKYVREGFPSSRSNCAGSPIAFVVGIGPPLRAEDKAGCGLVLRATTLGITIKSMQTISLKLPDDLLADLEREAKARRVTKSVLIRESLRAALRRPPNRRAASCYDMAHDLAGSLKGLPHDLARNPQYMEGFGE